MNKVNKFPMWARWGFNVAGFRIAGFHRGSAFRDSYPVFWRNDKWRVVFLPFTPYGVGFSRR